MENFHKFFKTYPKMDMDLLNGFLRDYIEHCKDLEVGFLPIHDSSEADCCDDDPYDPYYGEYDPQLDEEYQQAFDSIAWPSEVGANDEDALEQLRRAMGVNPYDEFDYTADVQYVVASTSYGQNETFFFMGDKDGAHGYSELGCSIAERWGNVFWNMSDRIDEAINDYFNGTHDVKLIGLQHIAPDEYHSWVVNKRIYEVTKKQ